MLLQDAFYKVYPYRKKLIHKWVNLRALYCLKLVFKAFIHRVFSISKKSMVF